jgi:hypothetical protein
LERAILAATQFLAPLPQAAAVAEVVFFQAPYLVVRAAVVQETRQVQPGHPFKALQVVLVVQILFRVQPRAVAVALGQPELME